MLSLSCHLALLYVSKGQEHRKGNHMTQKPDGGPAYPQSETLYDDGAELVRTSHGGMSLRDYFAGQALAGLMADPETTESKDNVALWCYRYADAMIAAREADQ
jgi:hypothetical protein